MGAPEVDAGLYLPVTAHTLRADGFDASEDGTGRGTPLVPVSVALRGRDGGATAELGDDQAFALRASQGGGDKPHVLAFDTTQVTSKANRSNPKPGDPCHPLAAGAHPPAVAFDTYNQSVSRTAHTLRDPNGTYGDALPAVAFNGRMDPVHGPVSGALDTDPSTQCAMTGMAVRRITPVEAERLQGFSDDYTRVPYRGKPAEDCPDGPRYKALGNSMAVPCMSWLGRRIAMVESAHPPQREPSPSPTGEQTP